MADCTVTYCEHNEGTNRWATPRILMCSSGHYLCRPCFVQLFEKCLAEEPFSMLCPFCRSDEFNEVFYAIKSMGPIAQESRAHIKQ